MSLTPKRKMTQKNLAAHRRNGPKSRGAVTPAGKARARQGHLRHGFYSQDSLEVMTSLGEDPKDYRHLLDSLEDNVAEGLEGQLVRQIARALWRMQRSERMQDGAALKRVRKGIQREDFLNSARFLDTHKTYQRLLGLGRTLNAIPNYVPTAEEVQEFVNGFGATPPDEIQKLFPLFQSLREAAAKAPGSANDLEGGGLVEPATDGSEVESMRHELKDVLFKVTLPYTEAFSKHIEQSEAISSKENIAALMAPQGASAALMQRMEDSNLRQLCRLTDMLAKIRNGALT